MTRHSGERPGVAPTPSRRSVLRYGAGAGGTTISGGQIAGSGAAAGVRQRARLEPEDRAPEARFGESVAVNDAGTIVLVGAPDASEPHDDGGVVYVYRRYSDRFVQTEKLTAENVQSGDHFGVAVAVDAVGRTALIGQRRDDTDGTDAVYVFERRNDRWRQTATLSPPADHQRGAVSGFGAAVALDGVGETAAIGAPWSGDLAFSAGSVLVAERRGDQWTEPTELGHEYGGSIYYGTAVDLGAAGRTGVAGGPVRRHAAEPIQGGFVQALRRTGGDWRQPTVLQANDATDMDGLGTAVACDAACQTVVAGRPSADAGGQTGRGGAVVFRRTPREWTQEAVLPYDGPATDRFGAAVAVDDLGRTALVSAPRGDTDAGPRAGTAALYSREGDEWTSLGDVVPDERVAGGSFGSAIGLDALGETAVVGAPAAGERETGVAYVFDRP